MIRFYWFVDTLSPTLNFSPSLPASGYLAYRAKWWKMMEPAIATLSDAVLSVYYGMYTKWSQISIWVLFRPLPSLPSRNRVSPRKGYSWIGRDSGMISIPQIDILFYVQYSRTFPIEVKNRMSIFVAVPWEPNVEILFFLPGGSTRKTSARLKAAADLSMVPKFFAFCMLNMSM